MVLAMNGVLYLNKKLLSVILFILLLLFSGCKINNEEEYNAISENTIITNWSDNNDSKENDFIDCADIYSIEQEKYHELNLENFNEICEYDDKNMRKDLNYLESIRVKEWGLFRGYMKTGYTVVINCLKTTELQGTMTPWDLLIFNGKECFYINDIPYLSIPRYVVYNNVLGVYDYHMTNGIKFICFYEYDLNSGDLLKEYVELYDAGELGEPQKVIQYNDDFNSFYDVEAYICSLTSVIYSPFYID